MLVFHRWARQSCTKAKLVELEASSENKSPNLHSFCCLKPNIYSYTRSRFRNICWWNLPKATTPFCLQTAWILNAFIYTGKCDSWVGEWCLGISEWGAFVSCKSVSFAIRSSPTHHSTISTDGAKLKQQQTLETMWLYIHVSSHLLLFA